MNFQTTIKSAVSQLIIGITDNGTVIGLADKDIELAMESLENKCIIVIEVSEGMSKPYHSRAEGLSRGTYIRLERTTAKATPEIIQELEWQARGIDFECLPVYQAELVKANLVKRAGQKKAVHYLKN